MVSGRYRDSLSAIPNGPPGKCLDTLLGVLAWKGVNGGDMVRTAMRSPKPWALYPKRFEGPVGTRNPVTVPNDAE